MKRTHFKNFNNRGNIQELSRDADDHSDSYYKNYSKGHHLQKGLITWPPKNYTCSFCRREFRSAQALGGHMNVHRRDRAKLRQLPSWLIESPHISVPDPNPNPNFPSSYPPMPPPASSSKFLTPYSSIPNLVPTQKNPSTTPSTSVGLSNPKIGNSIIKDFRPCIREFKSNIAAYHSPGKCFNLGRDLKKKGADEDINLELEMGLKAPKQVVDLELRLGYFN